MQQQSGGQQWRHLDVGLRGDDAKRGPPADDAVGLAAAAQFKEDKLSKQTDLGL